MQVKAIPFLAFDAGGVLELFDHVNHSDNVVRRATPAALASRLNDILTEGSLSTVKLSKEVTTGQQKWLDFHQEFAANVSRNKQVNTHSSAIKPCSWRCLLLIASRRKPLTGVMKITC